MTGPEHYKLAEALLADVTRPDGTIGSGEEGDTTIAAAQAHATLALAAATAANDPVRGMALADAREWDAAIGTDRPTPS